MIFFCADKPDLTISAIAKCLDYLRNQSDLIPGHKEEFAEGIRCIISAYDTVDESRAFWEAHKSYIDVHCVIQGEERISVCSLAEAQVGTYHAERDYLETVGVPTVDLLATAGTVLCLFPNDVHRTRVQTSEAENSQILKVIFKVPVELLGLIKEEQYD